MTAATTAGAGPLRWIIDYDLDGQAMMVGQMAAAIENEQTVYPQLGRDLAKMPGGNTYADYVNALVSQKPGDATAMFTSADGSQARWMKELAEKPDRHKGWANVESVSAKLVFNWGPYRIIPIGIRMKGDAKEYLWRESLFCTTECAMSNAFNILDPSREKLTVMMGSGTTALVNQSWQSLGEAAEASGLMDLQNAFFFRPQWIAGALAQQYPLIVFPRINELPGGYYPFFDEEGQAGLDGVAKSALDTLEIFLTELRTVDLTVAEDGSYAQEELETLLGKHWAGFRPGRVFRFFERPEEGESMALAKYAQHPFANQLSKWDGMHPVAVYQSRTGVFLFGYPVVGDTLILHMQVLSFERNEANPDELMLSLDVQQSDPGRIVMSGEMIEYVDRKTESVLEAG